MKFRIKWSSADKVESIDSDDRDFAVLTFKTGIGHTSLTGFHSTKTEWTLPFPYVMKTRREFRRNTIIFEFSRTI